MNDKLLREKIERIREAQTIITQTINELYNELNETGFSRSR
jgi:uncharacterized protein (UPF0335 family)